MGGVRIIPEYKDSKITPFKTNQQLVIERKEKQVTRNEQENALNNMNDFRQQIQNKQMDPLLELKINQPLQTALKPQMPEIYPSAYVPIPNPYYPLANNYQMPWQYTPNNVPIIKRYNISLGNGNGDITKLANLYEDILPSSNNLSLKNKINDLTNTILEKKNLKLVSFMKGFIEPLERFILNLGQMM